MKKVIKTINEIGPIDINQEETNENIIVKIKNNILKPISVGKILTKTISGNFVIKIYVDTHNDSKLKLHVETYITERFDKIISVVENEFGTSFEYGDFTVDPLSPSQPNIVVYTIFLKPKQNINENKSNKMKKVIRLKESDIRNIVKRIIKEQSDVKEWGGPSHVDDDNKFIYGAGPKPLLEKRKTKKIARDLLVYIESIINNYPELENAYQLSKELMAEINNVFGEDSEELRGNKFYNLGLDEQYKNKKK